MYSITRDGKPQLLLGEIILKLEAVKNKKLPLFIDLMDKRPMGIDSWRGDYGELSIQTEDFGQYNTGIVKEKTPYGDMHEMKIIGCENPTTAEWIGVLKEAVGKMFVGFKGGDFLMSEDTPVYLAEYGEAYFKTGDRIADRVYFVDVREDADKVYLITELVYYFS